MSSSKHWLIERRVRVYPRLFLGVLAVAVPIYAATFADGVDGRGRPPGTDFLAFWTAAKLAIQGDPAHAYDLALLSQVQLDAFAQLSAPTAWVHPPTFLLVVAPLAFLPYMWALALWTITGLVVYFLSLRPVLRSKKAWWIAAAFPACWVGIAHGQTQFVVAALIGGALLLLPRHQVLAGLLIGLLAFKPHLAVLFPLVLVAGAYWRAFLSAAVTSAAFIAASVYAFGSEPLRRWLDGMDLVARAIDVGALPVVKFVTPYAQLRLFGLGEDIGLAIHLGVAIAAASAVWFVWRRTTDLRLRGAAMVCGTFLVTPYAADYDLAVLAFPIAWLALIGVEQGWARGERNLLVLMWLLPAVTAPIALVSHISPTPWALGLALYFVLKRSAPRPRHDAAPPAVEGAHGIKSV